MESRRHATRSVALCTMASAGGSEHAARSESNGLQVGGLPRAAYEICWPTCLGCGKRMDFLAQVPLKRPLPLAVRSDLALVFACEGSSDSCRPQHQFMGYNAVILQKGTPAKELQSSKQLSRYVCAEMEVATEPDPGDLEFLANPELCDRVHHLTKIGGVPRWREHEVCRTPFCPWCGSEMKLILQLHATDRDWTSGEIGVESNFTGRGYAFVCPKECADVGAFLFDRY